MKKKIFYYSLISFFCLSLFSCGDTSTNSDSITDTLNTTETSASSESSDSSTLSESTVSETTSETLSSSSTSTSEYTTSETHKDFQILCINDFHGACISSVASASFEQYNIGIQKLGTIFKDYSKEKTTFILSAGDMWQGSIESNTNKGKYVTEAMNEIGFDAMTIGNHDFDWGEDALIANKEIANFPFLGANIINNNTQKRVDYAKDSVLIEKGGIKLGVIGIIGESQYSDITRTAVEHLSFDKTYEYVSTCSQSLRKQGADFIVLVPHQGWNGSDIKNAKIDTEAYEQKQILENCDVDAVFSGHEHNYNNSSYNNTPLLRAVCNGEAYSKLECTIIDGTTSINAAEVNYFSTNQYNSTLDDETIKGIYVSKYDVTEYSSEIIGTCTGYISAANMGFYGSQAGYEWVLNSNEYKTENIIGFFHNKGRKNFSSGNITNGLVWSCFTFDNEILIINVKGYIINHSTVATDGSTISALSNSYYHVRPTDCCNNIDDNEYYKIGIIDYLGLKIDKNYYNGEIIHCGVFIRDAVIQKIKKDASINASFYQS